MFAPRHRAVLAILALLPLGVTGCRALGVSKPPAPQALAPAPSLLVTETVQRHNRNAERVESLEAAPTVSSRSQRLGGGAYGKMALVRPREFRLSLEATGRGQVADFGSNSQEYWIWTAQGREKEKEFYVGHYDPSGAVPSGLLFQPDWVVEALGLRAIPEAEAGRITIERGDAANTMTLVHHRKGTGGEQQIKKTILDNQTGRIREHRFYAADGKTVLARALPSDYRSVPTTRTGTDGEKLTVTLPYHIRLEATPPEQEPLTLEISFRSVKLNQLEPDRQASLFAVPDTFEQMGYVRKDLDTLLGANTNSPRGGPTVRQTMPAPPPGARVRLSTPVPIGVDSEAQRVSGPAPLTADLAASPREPERLVRPRVPRPPGDIEPAPFQRSQISLR